MLAQFAPVDGIWFDMCWNQPSCNRYAIDGMRACGMNPELEEDRLRYASRVALAYMRRFAAMVREAAPEALVYFNVRPFTTLSAEADCITHVEIESLPTGGWGYLNFPQQVRRIRRLGIPYLGMTARFHKSWADFGGFKPYAALEFEISRMLAEGAHCCIGDQLHPRGVLDASAYALVERVYARAAPGRC